MIHPDQLKTLITGALADARVTITDHTGTMDHYGVRIVSAAFSGKNPLERRRMIHKVLAAPMADGRIHAMELNTQTPEEAGAPPRPE